jgi:DMSO/TMAO reductase YedYZ heme-binding membrane subunit
MNADTESSKLPENRLWQPVTIRWFTTIFGVSLGYAILRYHITGSVEWEHFPLFILNKATALASVIFVACSYLIGRVIRWHNDNPGMKLVVIKFCGLMGFSLAFIHSFMAVCLLTPAYLGKYFLEDGRLNFEGELGMAVGVVALWALAIPAITTLPMMPKAIGGIRWKRTQRMGYFCLVLVVAHMIVLGLRGWLAPSHWPWNLPPISLIACLAAIVPLLARIRVYLGKGS